MLFQLRFSITPRFQRFKRDQFITQAKENLGRRVVVFGNLKSNYLGEPMHMRVSGIEPCPNEQDLPNIPRMSGRIPVAAGSTLHRIYIPGAKYGK